MNSCHSDRIKIIFSLNKLTFVPKSESYIVRHGGVLSVDNKDIFIGFTENSNIQFVYFGDMKDSFVYSLNTFVYYQPQTNLNMDQGIQSITFPEIKNEYIKINEHFFFIQKADSLEISLKEIIRNKSDTFRYVQPLLDMPNIPLSNYGNTINLLNEKKLTLITVWASWCLPCVQSMPKLDSLIENYNNKIQIVSFNYKDTDKNAMVYQNNEHIIYDKIDETGYKKLNAGGLPYYSLFDEKGNLIGNRFNLKDTRWILSKIK